MGHWIVIIAKWMLLIEVALVCFFVIMNYAIRIRQYLLLKNHPHVIDKIKAVFFEYLKNQPKLTLRRVRFFKAHILDVLKEMERFEVAPQYAKRWELLKKEIAERVIYPKAKNLYKSWRPYKRYYAARYYLTYYKPDYNPMIKRLIADPVMLVALNASRVAYKYESSDLINESISIFSTYRKMRQSIYVTIAKECDGKVAKIVVNRLCYEKDPYIRAFCYQLLTQLPTHERFDDRLQADIYSDILQLRINTLQYAAYHPDYRYYLAKCIDDESWEIRAVAADWIGRTQYFPALPALAMRLADHAWWVRLRSAEALGKMGDKGIQILRNQKPETDRYAYDAAQQVLCNLVEVHS